MAVEGGSLQNQTGGFIRVVSFFGEGKLNGGEIDGLIWRRVVCDSHSCRGHPNGVTGCNVISTWPPGEMCHGNGVSVISVFFLFFLGWVKTNSVTKDAENERHLSGSGGFNICRTLALLKVEQRRGGVCLVRVPPRSYACPSPRHTTCCMPYINEARHRREEREGNIRQRATGCFYSGVPPPALSVWNTHTSTRARTEGESTNSSFSP